MVKTNHHLIKGNELTEEQKAKIVEQLLATQNTPEKAVRFYRGVKFPGNIDDDGLRRSVNWLKKRGLI